MSCVVFMRAVNVGGHQTFRPALLAKELEHLGVVSVGAAGTFVVPGRVAEKSVRAEFLKRMDFAPELTICKGEELLALVKSEPFGKTPPNEPRPYVTVMAGKATPSPRLPRLHPPGEERWEVKILALSGPFALSLYRRLGKHVVDANALVEKAFGSRGTTRGWTTILRVARALEPRS